MMADGQVRQRNAAIPMRGYRLDQQVEEAATEILVDFWSAEAISDLILWTSVGSRLRVKIGVGSYVAVGATRATAASLGAFTAGETKQGTLEVKVPLGADSEREELGLNVGYGI